MIPAKPISGLLALNIGSSSIKFSLYEYGKDTRRVSLLYRGKVENIKRAPRLTILDHNHKTVTTEKISNKNGLDGILESTMRWITSTYPHILIKAVGHRVVHGGTWYSKPVIINKDALKKFKKFIPIVPQHQPACLAGIQIISKILPKVPQVACFDTSFHSTMPYCETLFGLPHKYWEEGIKRYGYHGLSFQFISQRLPKVSRKGRNSRVIIAHLGHGASLCALKDQKSIATTMGFSAIDGLPMGTRSGSIDPGVLFYLMNQMKLPAKEVEEILYEKSGLLGVSGISDDMRQLISSKNPSAKEAIDFFCYRVQREMGALIAVLKGVDMIVFTGGIGENVPYIRSKVCENFKWLQLKVNQKSNTNCSVDLPCQINDLSSSVAVWVIPTDEESIIAKGIIEALA